MTNFVFFFIVQQNSRFFSHNYFMKFAIFSTIIFQNSQFFSETDWRNSQCFPQAVDETSGFFLWAIGKVSSFISWVIRKIRLFFRDRFTKFATWRDSRFFCDQLMNSFWEIRQNVNNSRNSVDACKNLMSISSIYVARTSLNKNLMIVAKIILILAQIYLFRQLI